MKKILLLFILTCGAFLSSNAKGEAAEATETTKFTIKIIPNANNPEGTIRLYILKDSEDDRGWIEDMVFQRSEEYGYEGKYMLDGNPEIPIHDMGDNTYSFDLPRATYWIGGPKEWRMEGPSYLDLTGQDQFILDKYYYDYVNLIIYE